MTQHITLPLPPGFDEDDAVHYASALSTSITKLLGKLAGTHVFQRNDRNQITHVTIFFEDYTTGNPQSPSVKLLLTPLEDVFPPPTSHREQHLRGKSLTLLSRAGITCVGHLVRCCDQAYLRSNAVPQFGKDMLIYVQKHLADLGLSIPEELE